MTALVDEQVSAGPYTLRPWVPADLPWVHDACQDPEIQRFTRLPRPYRAPHALALLEASRAGRAYGSAYRFAVVRTDSDELLGAIAVAVGDGGIGGIGGWVVWEARRQGVARTVLAALAQWSGERLGLDSVGLTLAVTNDAGRRAAEGAGFGWIARRPGEASDGDRRVDAVVYRHAGR